MCGDFGWPTPAGRGGAADATSFSGTVVVSATLPRLVGLGIRLYDLGGYLKPTPMDGFATQHRTLGAATTSDAGVTSARWAVVGPDACGSVQAAVTAPYSKPRELGEGREERDAP